MYTKLYCGCGWILSRTNKTHYITVFVKMKFFKIWGNIIRHCRFAFFFSRQRFSAVSWPICTKFGTSVSSCMRFILKRAIFEKFKNQVTKAKKHRNFGQIFTPAVTSSLVVTKRLKCFAKSLLRWHLDIYTFQKMSLWQSRTVQFSQTLGSMERHKIS